MDGLGVALFQEPPYRLLYFQTILLDSDWLKILELIVKYYQRHPEAISSCISTN